MLTQNLVESIARNLSYNNCKAVYEGEVFYPWKIIIMNKYTIDFHYDKHKDRIEIGCSWCIIGEKYTNIYNHIPYKIREDNSNKFKITVSPKKTGYQIAQDINKRLLPEYIKAFDKAYYAYIEASAELRKRQATTIKLASIIGGTPSHHDGEKCNIYEYIQVPSRSNSIHIHAKIGASLYGAEIKITSISNDDLEEIMQWLASKKQNKQLVN